MRVVTVRFSHISGLSKVAWK